MFNLDRKSSDLIFQGLFWVSIVAGLVLMVLVVILGWQLYDEAPEEIDAGVVLATGALALFTAFLWCSAAITARFARAEMRTSV